MLGYQQMAEYQYVIFPSRNSKRWGWELVNWTNLVMKTAGEGDATHSSGESGVNIHEKQARCRNSVLLTYGLLPSYGCNQTTRRYSASVAYREKGEEDSSSHQNIKLGCNENS
jgi:hypothetical protein